MPESEYLTEQGVCYSNQEIKKLVSARTKSDDNRGKGEVNRIYGSKEAYLGTLYDVILGYIDQNRFITMEKSAIALKMTNGTGQFIRDYMFPKNTSNTIATISEQLDSYRQIKEKIEDLRKRIELLSEIQASGKELVRLQTGKDSGSRRRQKESCRKTGTMQEKSAGTFCLAGGSTAEIDTGQYRFKSQRFRGKTAAVRGIR